MIKSPAFPVMPPVGVAGYPAPAQGLTKLEWVATHIYAAAAGDISASNAVAEATALLATLNEVQS